MNIIEYKRALYRNLAVFKTDTMEIQILNISS